MRRWWTVLLRGGMGAILASSVAFGAVIHVPADQPTIQAGINAASNGDMVLVGPGLYVEALTISKQLVVTSAGGPLVTTLRGGANIQSAAVTLSGFTLRDPSGMSREGVNGGGFSTLRVNHCLFVGYDLAIVTTGPQCEITNNTLVNGNRAFAIYGEYSTIKNNVVANNIGYGTWFIHSTTVLDYNDFFNNTPNYGGGTTPGTHDISADPQFRDPGSGDFRLNYSSPCIDAGDPAPEYRDPDGTRADMGAFPTRTDVPFPGGINLGIENTGHVLSHSPRFFWSYFDTLPPPQVAYTVEVGSDSDWTAAEMWSSGDVTSSDTSAHYAGGALLDGADYFYRVRVNNGIQWGGWNAASFHMNAQPGIPSLARPVGQEQVPFSSASLYAHNSADPDGDVPTYDFELYANPSLSTLVYSKYGVVQQSDSTSSGSVPGLNPGVEYWWRARGFDGYEYSDWSAVESFIARWPLIQVPADKPTIQAAIAEAWNGDTIRIAGGTYTGPLDPLGKQIVITGTAPVESTIVYANAPGVDVVSISHGEGSSTVIRSLTIRGADGASGIRVSASSPVLRDLLIDSNAATADGDGVYVTNGNPAIRGCEFRHNTAGTKGGGVYVASGASVTIDSSRFFFNSVGDGGGAIAKVGSGSLTFTNNVVYANSNTDDWGGAVYIENAPGYLIRNNTIIGNSSTSGNGAGITSLSPTGGQIKNNIISSNSGGYGVYVLVGGGSPPQVTYNDVWGNSGGGYLGVSSGAGSLSVDPKVCDTASLDFGLDSTSPCRGTGEGGVDMGARGVGCAATTLLPPSVTAIAVGQTGDNLHVTDHTPLISWGYLDPQGRPHTKSQIEVGTDPDWGVAEKWLPPVILGPDTTIGYGGTALGDGFFYYIRARVFSDTLALLTSSFYTEAKPKACFKR